METVTDFIFGGSKITADSDCSHEIKRRLLLGRKVMTDLDSIIKKQRHYFANKGPSSQDYGFSSAHVWMWEFDCEESWAQKNWCFWTVVLEKTPKSPLDCKEIQPVSPKGDLSVLSIHWKDWCWSWSSSTLAIWCKELTRLKRLWCWEIEGREEWDEYEMVGWHHPFSGMSLSKLRELVMNREAWHVADHGVSMSQTRLSNWTELS